MTSTQQRQMNEPARPAGFVTRRQACQLLAAGALAGWQAARAEETPAAAPVFQLKYALASCMYGTLPLAEILPAVHQTGAEVIDLWPRVHGNQREQVEEMGHEAFRELLQQNNVQLGMTTRYDLGPLKLAEEIDFVHKFGGRLIVTGARKGTSAPLKEQVQDFVKQLQPHVRAAEEHGVMIAIENHGNSLIESPDSLRYFAEFSTSPNLGLALAPYHLPQDPELLAGLIRDLGPKLVHFYAWEHGDGCHEKLPKAQEMKQLPGLGTLNFAPLLSALKDIEFSGWTEIFMHPVPRGIPILETADEVTAAINRSRQSLQPAV